MNNILTRRESKLLDLLYRTAIDSDPAGNSRIAAALVVRGDVAAIKTNSRRTHPFQAKYGKNSDCIYLHAETSVISSTLKHFSKEDLSRSSMYIVRAKMQEPGKKNWSRGLAKPCIGCMRAIVDFDIRKVIYSCDTGYEIMTKNNAVQAIQI